MKKPMLDDSVLHHFMTPLFMMLLLRLLLVVVCSSFRRGDTREGGRAAMEEGHLTTVRLRVADRRGRS